MNWNRNNPLNLTVNDVSDDILYLSIHRYGETYLRFCNKSIAITCILRYLITQNKEDETLCRRLLTHDVFTLDYLCSIGINTTLRTIRTAFRLYNFYFV